MVVILSVVVESLDTAFKNVCELDLQYNVDKVYHVLDEVVLGGMVVDTKRSNINESIKEMAQAEKGSAASTSSYSTSDIFNGISSILGRS